MKRWGWIMWGTYLSFVLVGFIILESVGWREHQTLSRFVWTITQAWPLATWFIGIFQGGLAVHLWWRWDPKKFDNEG